MELALLTDAYIHISIYDSTESCATSFYSHRPDEFDQDTILVNCHERFRPNDVSARARL